MAQNNSATKRRRDAIGATGGARPRIGAIGTSRLVSVAPDSVDEKTTGEKREEERKKKARMAEKQKAAVLVAVYATKGGVGKSTSVALLAAAAVRANRRVLVIDMDAQCSVTRILAPTYPVGDRPSAPKIESKTVPLWSWASPLYDGLHPAATLPTQSPSADSLLLPQRQATSSSSSSSASSSSSSSDVSLSSSVVSSLPSLASLPSTLGVRQQRAAVPANISDLLGEEMRNQRTDTYTPLRVSQHVSLVPGSPSLTRFYTELLVDGDDMLRSVRRSAFRRIALAAAAACGAALVLVDMSPSSGVLNKAVLMSCDVCVPCTFSDTVSLSAACMFFTDTLGEWIKWQEAAVRKDREARADKCLSPYISRFNYRSRPPTLFPMLVSGFTLEPPPTPSSSSSSSSSAPQETEGERETKTAADSEPRVLSLADSHRILDATALLASDRVPVAVKRLFSAPHRSALRPMAPKIAEWLSQEPFTLARALAMHADPELQRVGARFDDLLAELAAFSIA
jgi:cellulose biosynthesis protein BcsQ